MIFKIERLAVNFDSVKGTINCVSLKQDSSFTDKKSFSYLFFRPKMNAFNLFGGCFLQMDKSTLYFHLQLLMMTLRMATILPVLIFQLQDIVARTMWFHLLGDGYL